MVATVLPALSSRLLEVCVSVEADAVNSVFLSVPLVRVVAPPPRALFTPTVTIPGPVTASAPLLSAAAAFRARVPLLTVVVPVYKFGSGECQCACSEFGQPTGVGRGDSGAKRDIVTVRVNGNGTRAVIEAALTAATARIRIVRCVRAAVLQCAARELDSAIVSTQRTVVRCIICDGRVQDTTSNCYSAPKRIDRIEGRCSSPA